MTASTSANPVVNPALRRSLPRSLAIGAILGLAGFGLNQFAVPLGFHVHFLVGSIVLVFAIRLDRSGIATFLAGVVAGYATVPLWGHPWAWLIFSCEALAVAIASRRYFPAIFVDAAYWLAVGVPLVVATYGGVMSMDATSVSLIAAKQGLNGVANVACATMLIWLASSAMPGLAKRFQPLAIRTLIGNILSVAILIPVIYFLWQAFSEQDRGLFRGAARDHASNAYMVEAALKDSLGKLASAALNHSPRQVSDALLARFEIVSAVVVAEEGEIVEVAERDGDLVVKRDVPDASAALRDALDRTLLSDTQHIQGNGIERYDVICEPAAGPVCSLYYLLRHDGPWSRTVVAVRLDLFATTQMLLHHGEIMTFADESGLMLSSDVVDQLGGAAAWLRQPQDIKSSFGIELIMPAAVKGSLMSRWTAAVAYGVAPIEPAPGLRLLVGSATPLKGAVLEYRDFQRNVLVGAAVFMALALCGVFGITVLLVRPLERLQRQVIGIVDVDRPPSVTSNATVAEFAESEAAIGRASAALDAERGEVRRLQNRLELLIREAPIAIFAIERRAETGWRVVYHSPTLVVQTGIDPADFTDFFRWAERIHPEDRAEKDRQWRKFRETGESAVTFRMRDANGDYRWLFNELKRVDADSSDTEEFAIGVIMNIDDRKREQERIESASRLITLGEMATGMAHELNQPLNVIRMAAQNMMLRANRDQLPDDLRSYLAEKLQRIDAQTRRAANTIEHMCIFGRRPGTEPAAFDVEEAVRAALDLTSPQLKAADIVVDHASAGSLPPVLGHSQLIEQVMINLLLNARDAIVARQASNAAVSFRGCVGIVTLWDGKAVVVRLSDNGGGIPKDIVARIFEPFFTTKPVGKGTGLGLSVSYGIVTDMGGGITVTTGGAGTTFEIRLPPHEQTRDEARPEAAEAGA